MQLPGFHLRSFASGFPLLLFLDPSKLLWRPGQRGVSGGAMEPWYPRSGGLWERSVGGSWADGFPW